MKQAARESVLDGARKVLLAQLPDAWAIYVYGSFARGDERPGSDLDLAVLLPPGKPLADTLGLTAKVSRQVHREVDLVDLREAGLDLIRELLREGRLLFARDATQTLAWEAERMTDYAEFNPRRGPLLAMYLRDPLRAPT